MIMYFNAETIKWLKKTLPTREVKFHDISFIAIEPYCPFGGVIIKDIEEIPKNE